MYIDDRDDGCPCRHKPSKRSTSRTAESMDTAANQYDLATQSFGFGAGPKSGSDLEFDDDGDLTNVDGMDGMHTDHSDPAPPALPEPAPQEAQAPAAASAPAALAPVTASMTLLQQGNFAEAQRVLDGALAQQAKAQQAIIDYLEEVERKAPKGVEEVEVVVPRGSSQFGGEAKNMQAVLTFNSQGARAAETLVPVGSLTQTPVKEEEIAAALKNGFDVDMKGADKTQHPMFGLPRWSNAAMYSGGGGQVDVIVTSHNMLVPAVTPYGRTPSLAARIGPVEVAVGVSVTPPPPAGFNEAGKKMKTPPSTKAQAVVLVGSPTGSNHVRAPLKWALAGLAFAEAMKKYTEGLFKTEAAGAGAGAGADHTMTTVFSENPELHEELTHMVALWLQQFSAVQAVWFATKAVNQILTKAKSGAGAGGSDEAAAAGEGGAGAGAGPKPRAKAGGSRAKAGAKASAAAAAAAEAVAVAVVPVAAPVSAPAAALVSAPAPAPVPAPAPAPDVCLKLLGITSEKAANLLAALAMLLGLSPSDAEQAVQRAAEIGRELAASKAERALLEKQLRAAHLALEKGGRRLTAVATGAAYHAGKGAGKNACGTQVYVRKTMDTMVNGSGSPSDSGSSDSDSGSASSGSSVSGDSGATEDAEVSAPVQAPAQAPAPAAQAAPAHVVSAGVPKKQVGQVGQGGPVGKEAGLGVHARGKGKSAAGGASGAGGGLSGPPAPRGSGQMSLKKPAPAQAEPMVEQNKRARRGDGTL